MEVSIKDASGNSYDGYISLVEEKDIRSISKLWKFKWADIYADDKLCFKLLKDGQIQGLLKLEWENDEYVIMKNVEVSPENYGSKGLYVNIAELLISFACYQTFKLNKGSYIGYLAFTSKGVLMSYYEDKYGAELIFRDRMIIAPQAALKLILKHLEINLKP